MTNPNKYDMKRSVFIWNDLWNKPQDSSAFSCQNLFYGEMNTQNVYGEINHICAN